MAVALLVVVVTATAAKPLVCYRPVLVQYRCVNTLFATRNTKE